MGVRILSESIAHSACSGKVYGNRNVYRTPMSSTDGDTKNKERRFVRLPHRTKRLSLEYRGGNPLNIICKGKSIRKFNIIFAKLNPRRRPLSKKFLGRRQSDAEEIRSPGHVDRRRRRRSTVVQAHDVCRSR